jgi:iron complex outermembrane receptor protein
MAAAIALSTTAQSGIRNSRSMFRISPSSFGRRALFLANASIITLGLASTAQAQDASVPSSAAATALPGITVTAPSPIVRRKPVVRPVPVRVSRGTGRNAPATPQPAPLQQTAAVPFLTQGTLPIVTDQFATVTVVSSDELRRSGGATLGDVLFSKPGITGSSYAPGASSRPIIRGLDVNRVGIVENGTGAGGVSDLGEDHFVPVDPLSSNQIEVIRGPAALRYGSTSIGGVVSATNNRIPDALPPCTTTQSGCMNAETRTSVSSVDRGVDGAVLLDAGGGNVAVHADVFGRKSSDYAIPSYPYLADPTRPFNGRQPNSAAQTSGGSVGGSYIFDGGFFGAAITQNNALYSIPGIGGTESRTRIDSKQTRFTTKGEYRPDSAAIEAIRFWTGVTDYKHNEIGLADITDPTTFGVRQTFTNKEQEGRVEVQFMPWNARLAQITTAVGVQAGHQSLNAPSPDDPGSLFNGLFSANTNTRVAGYVFNELQFSTTTKAQVAARVEHVALQGSTPNFPADFVPDFAPQASIDRNLAFTPKSGSVGLIQNLPQDLVASLTAQYVERAPKPAELFSRGAHDATATFDIGNPNLTIEIAKTVELGLRRATGPLRFEATVYYTRFDNFIYRRLTGALCGEDFNSCGNGDAGNTARQAVYSQRNATFRGGEFQSQLDVAKVYGGMWGIENQFDVVRATFDDGSNVPRIPPVRAGGGLFWRDANWLARVNLLHAFAQNNIAVIGETPTPGYNLLKAELSYTTKLNPVIYGAREMTLGIVGNNLLNENIRSATSYNKDEVLLPGIGVRAFANLKF